MAEDEHTRALREMFRYFGPKRALQLLGYATWWAVLGYSRPEDLGRASERYGGPGRRAIYLALKDVREFRTHLQAKGFEVADERELAELLRSMAGRLPPSELHKLGLEEAPLPQAV